jgi:hypothetical protein
MSDFTTPLNGLQTDLAGLTSNSTVSSPNSNSLVFDVTPVGNVAVFDLTGAQLAGGPGDNYNITFSNETSASTIVINVTGSFTEGGGENFNGDTYLNEHVIWNFEDATSVNVKSWHGAVLAWRLGDERLADGRLPLRQEFRRRRRTARLPGRGNVAVSGSRALDLGDDGARLRRPRPSGLPEPQGGDGVSLAVGPRSASRRARLRDRSAGTLRLANLNWGRVLALCP